MSSFKILIPNLITSLRLILAVIVFFIITTNNYRIGILYSYQIGGLILLIALITDLIDGIIARKLNSTTRFGYYFEHIIDVFLMIPLFYLAFRNLSFVLASVLLGLEIIVISISLKRIFFPDSVRWPNIWGKVSFGFFGVTGCVFLLMWQTSLWTVFFPLANILLLISVILRFLSILCYLKEVMGYA